MPILLHQKFFAKVIAVFVVSFGLSVPSFASDGAANLAMIAEPQTLDPMTTTSDLVGTLMQHVYEPLYTFDAKWAVVPMLAEGQPKSSPDGLTHHITIRKGVKFHNGREMNAEDVLASLKRWMDISPRGKLVAKEVASILPKGAWGIEIKLKTPYAPLFSQLALPTSMAAIMPKETIAVQMQSFIGTGPYQLKERKPDQFTVLKRFADYSARKEQASGYSGRREALIEELRFVPVPNANTRVEGSLSGQFDYADLLPVEAMTRLEKAAGHVVPIMTPSFGFPYLVFNTKEGILGSIGMRQAVQEALGPGEMMAAAFGDTRFFVVEPNHFPKGTPFYATTGAEKYNRKNADKARQMAQRSAYKGETIRIMASRQYEFHYNMALVMAEELKRAGFKTELQIVDWATLVQRRNDPKLWDIYITHSPLFPEPMLSPPQLGDGAPGWWHSSQKERSLTALNREMDPAKRGVLWSHVQEVVYTEVPYIQVGKFNSLSARSVRLEDYQPAAWPFFWNARLK